jgi:hypothetical protein
MRTCVSTQAFMLYSFRSSETTDGISSQSDQASGPASRASSVNASSWGPGELAANGLRSNALP